MPYKTKKIGFSTLFLKWFLIMKYVQFMDLTLAAIYLFLKIMNQFNFEVCDEKKNKVCSYRKLIFNINSTVPFSKDTSKTGHYG